MTIGFVLLIAAGLLVLFGAGQRVLDRLRLTDREAILFIVLIIAGGFLPEIPVADGFSPAIREKVCLSIPGAMLAMGLL